MPGALRFAPSLYAIGLFVSAFLLFAVQPMFTKMVLPLLGGAPTVWSSSHGVFPGRATLRLCLRPLHHPPIAIWRGRTCTSGPTGYRSSDVADCRHPTPRLPPTDDVALWLIGILALSIGLPFAAPVHERPSVAKLVRCQRSQSSAQSLRSLCSFQSRFVCRPAFLSDHRRAIPDAPYAGRTVVDRFRHVCRRSLRPLPSSLRAGKIRLWQVPQTTSVCWPHRLFWVAVAAI